MRQLRTPSRWIPTPAEARRAQDSLRERVTPRKVFRALERVAGVDCSVARGRVRAAVCVFTYPELALVEEVRAERALEFPYIPGLLAFREIPAILDALALLSRSADMFLVDGHGLAHPRRIGVASHLGVEIDRPTIGCGKSLLCGRHGALGRARGSTAELVDRGEVIGAALRTRVGVKPIYVSIGHRVDLASALEIALAAAPRFRLPEPIRRADRSAAL